MVKVTIFSGHNGRLNYNNNFYFTLFGNCELVRPTLAKQLLAQRQVERQETAEAETPPQRGGVAFQVNYGQRHKTPGVFFLTIFGNVTIKLPTLAEEFLDLRETIRSGMLTMSDWERSMADMGRPDAVIGSLTLFASFEECSLPSEDEEVDSLAVHRQLGNVSESAGRALQLGIGQREGERRATLRQAILAEV